LIVQFTPDSYSNLKHYVYMFRSLEHKMWHRLLRLEDFREIYIDLSSVPNVTSG